MKTLTDFIFLSSKITADSDCSHEIKWCSLLGRKSVTNLDTLPTKVSLVKVMVFSVVTCGYEIWTIKKAERWRIDAFEVWCWRFFRVPWTARRSNQSILKEISPEYQWMDWCWSWNSNTWPPDAKWLIGKDPDPGKDWRLEEKGTTEDEMVGWHHQLDGHEFDQAPGVGVGQGSLACCSQWVTKSWA